MQACARPSWGVGVFLREAGKQMTGYEKPVSSWGRVYLGRKGDMSGKGVDLGGSSHIKKKTVTEQIMNRHAQHYNQTVKLNIRKTIQHRQ